MSHHLPVCRSAGWNGGHGKHPAGAVDVDAVDVDAVDADAVDVDVAAAEVVVAGAGRIARLAERLVD